MTRRARRTHSAAFKVKVALAAIKGEKTLAELATAVFGDRGAAEPAVDVKELHAKIGELTLQKDFLSGALGKAGLLSAKR